MKVYTTEEEQVQALRDWFKKNGVSLLIVVLFGLSAFFAWNYWKNENMKHVQAASVLYEKLQQSNSDDMQEKIANELNSKYKSTIYGKVGALYLTNKKVENKNWQQVEEDYKWIYDNLSDWPDLQVVVFENWIRAQLENNKVAEALKNLEQEEGNRKFSKQYPLNYYNLQGDVLHKNNKDQEALQAFNKALEVSNTDPALKQQMVQYINWITLKRNDLLTAKAPK